MRKLIALLALGCLVSGPVPSALGKTAPSMLGLDPVGTTASGVRVLAPEAVWPAGAPLDRNWPGLIDQPVHEELRDNGESLWNVTEPAYQAFLPAAGKATGAAVIVAPGGGFRLLAIHHEGTQVAQWLAEHGIAAFVLKYRLIQTPSGESNEAMRQRANSTLKPGVGGEPGVTDGLEALRRIREHARDYAIDPARIGVVGFSAGGHVAGMMALADKAARPDFAGLIYGFPFGQPMPALPPANLPYPEGTPKEPWLRPAPTPAPGRLPPLFLAMAQDDLLVGSGFHGFQQALSEAGYAPETHLYERGKHGFGMKKSGGTADHWIEEFAWWIEAEGFTKPR
ncbi:alpha/beta hydrolase [Novosphingobium profundi]|uniref:alpha/beta hydrolase n=1 Tax=Novosphingobium profundi TaxID=1774954 RepID=UPI001BDABEC6|nr:alpha/beta hydrolase [Novosphingobium profundi]MBT0671021.1 alpha/beta hydrolase [Novosphingobium profundi]